jgi:hypothetical protein
MAARLSAWYPTATMIYALIVGVLLLGILLIPTWRRASQVWGRAHPIWVAAIGAAIFGVGFTTWSGWLDGIILAVLWFAAWALLRPLR